MIIVRTMSWENDLVRLSHCPLVGTGTPRDEGELWGPGDGAMDLDLACGRRESLSVLSA